MSDRYPIMVYDIDPARWKVMEPVIEHPESTDATENLSFSGGIITSGHGPSQDVLLATLAALDAAAGDNLAGLDEDGGVLGAARTLSATVLKAHRDAQPVGMRGLTMNVTGGDDVE